MSAEDWTERFSGTRALPLRVRRRLVQTARVRSFAKGAVVFSPHKVPDGLLFLSRGRIRVSQRSEGGREIVLYRVEAGESCVLTTACMLAEEAYNAEGMAETDVTLISLPKPVFEQLSGDDPAFRKFVFAAYSRRLIDLMRVIDDVAFGRMDVRLAERLLAMAGERREVVATHRQLSRELGTAREVVSRILNDFQKRALIAQTRGRIALVDKAGLRALAEGA